MTEGRYPRDKIRESVARNAQTRTMHFETPRARWEWALQAHESGLKTAEIAARLGVSGRRVLQLVQKAQRLWGDETVGNKQLRHWHEKP